MKNNNAYGANEIKVLEGLEPVRQRPGMYIGSTDVNGLHHMVYEIVDNAVDEALAGHCNNICVTIKEDGYVEIIDDGRGIPVEKHSKTGRSALETVFTVLHAGGKFESTAYKVSGGLHGVGASVVNALSEHLDVKVHRNGNVYRQQYKKGGVLQELEVVGESDYTGTVVSFKPDKDIFETTEFDYDTISLRLKRSAYLTPGVTFTLVDERDNNKKRYYFEGGIRSWLKNLIGEQKTIGEKVYLSKEGVSKKGKSKGKGVMLEMAFGFVENDNNNILSFANNIPTADGGSHVRGFRRALLKVINELAKNKGKIDKKIGKFKKSDIWDGLYAIVTVKIKEPQFQGQTKGRLGNYYVRPVVERMVYNFLKQYFTDNPEKFDIIVEKIQKSAKARMAAKLARKSVLKKENTIGGVLPGKLTDCSRKSKNGTELYIVEGNSAGGSAKQGRDSSFQAILPLRGKILNTEKGSIKRIMQNKEIQSLIKAIGSGLKDAYDESKLRYERIVIMTDADVDGAHIRVLLLTFFFRYMKPLIESGHLYIAVPPIYKIKQGKKEEYIYRENLEKSIDKYGFDRDRKITTQRYKGLGEMNPAQLWETTMDPQHRRMMQLSIDDAMEADRLFRVLMGEDVSSRKHFILTNAKKVKELDI